MKRLALILVILACAQAYGKKKPADPPADCVAGYQPGEILGKACPPPQPLEPITIRVEHDAAQRALDEAELMRLMLDDFRNMDSTRGHVDLKTRRRMDVLMKRLMTKQMWSEP
jgi:hypothetical protein